MSMKKITKFVVYSEYLLCTLCTLHTVKRLFCCSSQLHVRAHDENQKMLVLLSYSGYFTFYMLLIHNKNAIGHEFIHCTANNAKQQVKYVNASPELNYFFQF